MKKYILLIINSLLFITVKGQYTSPEVIATSGDFFTGTNVTLSWTAGEVISETFNGTTAILTQGFQQPNRKWMISGQLTYRNAVNTPLTGTSVYLKTLSGIIVDSTLTMSNGSFRFYGTTPGTYLFGVNITKPWGGVNANDALQVLRHFVGYITLTDLYLKAADVNNSHNINSIDALNVAKRFTGLLTSFNISDWLYTADTIILGASPVVHNLKAICAGDVNGSYIPPLKNSNTVELVPEGEIRGQPGKEIVLPVIAMEKISMGAISLVLDLANPSVRITKVEMPTDNGTLVYNVIGSQLRISWYSTQPLIIEKDAPVFFITLVSDRQIEEHQQTILFRPANESEIAGTEGAVYPEVKWSIPAVYFDNQPVNQLFTGIIPNPFSTNTRFVYSLPEDAEVSFTVFNALGAVVKVIPAGQHPEGLNLYTFDGSQLQEGVYLVRFEVNGSAGKKFETRRMVITW